jgi:uncharacterized protein YutE (UPF0331/DUF86 family)
MTKAPIRIAIVTEKIAYIREMLALVRRLPITNYDEFVADFRTPAAAESYVRRALEALFDLGRHLLSKAFAIAPIEYKEIAADLLNFKILTDDEATTLRQMAGYRNRMVHFYNEVGTEELYHICRDDLVDFEKVCDALVHWIQSNPDKTDTSL